MFILVKDIVKIMSEMAPARLAEDWDNVGLQVGRYEKEVRVILWTGITWDCRLAGMKKKCG